MRSNGHASPDAIEREVDEARAQVHSTIDAIQSKLTPGQLMDQSLGYLRRTLPAEFTSNLGSTVRDNPLPVALVGVGLAWLMWSGRPAARDEYAWHRADPDERFRRHSGDAEWGLDASKPSPGVGDKMQRAADSAGAKVSDVTQRIKDRASQATDATRDAAQRTRERVSEGASRAGDTMRRAGDRLSEGAERSRQQVERARRATGEFAEQQPLALAAIGVAVGAVLGAMLPPTRREDELVGDTRDELLGSAKRSVEQEAEQLREPARRVMDHARDELTRATGAAPSQEATTGRVPTPRREPISEGDGLAHSTVEAGGPFPMPTGLGSEAHGGDGLAHSTADAQRQPRITPTEGTSGEGGGTEGRRDIAG